MSKIGKRDKRLIILISFLLLTLPLTVILLKERLEIRRQAAFGTVDVLLSPGAKTENVGREFSVGIKIQALAKRISGVDLSLTYDKDVLEVVNLSGNTTGANSFTNEFIANKGTETGKIRLSVLAKKSSLELPTGEITVATITFKGKKAGSSQVAFTDDYQIVGFSSQQEDVSLGIANKTGGNYTIALLLTPTPSNTPTPPNTPTSTPTPSPTPTPTPTQTPTPTPFSPQISFAIKFTGMGETKPALKVKLTVVNDVSGNKKDFSGIEVSADINRIYHPSTWLTLTDIPTGPNYNLFVKGPKHLKRRMAARISLYPNQDTRNNFDWTGKPLEPGDLPDPNQNFKQDGKVDAHDASLLLDRLYFQTESDLAVADLNYDGIVNLNDFSLLVATLSQKYEDED